MYKNDNYLLLKTQRKAVSKRYQILWEEEKESKCQYHCEYKEQKQKQVEYMRNYHLTHKNKLFNRLLRFF